MPASWEAASEEEKHVFTGRSASQMELTQATKTSVFFVAQEDRCGSSGLGELAMQCQAGKNWSSTRCPGLVWKGWPAVREEVEKQTSLPGNCLLGYASSRPGYGGGQGAPSEAHNSLSSSQSCPNQQQLLTTIRQLQVLLKGQETRFAEGIRNMKSRLTTLQNILNKMAPGAPPVSCPALDAPADGRKFGSKYLVDHEVHFTCNPGFQLVGPSSIVCLANGTWTGEKPHCRAASECSSQPCHNGGTCVEGANQYRCICPAGRTGNLCQNQTQPDVNECEIYGQMGSPRLCLYTCVNTPGSFRCTCPSGYRALADGKTCEDVDECAGSQHTCPQGTTCFNTGGSFQCVRPECPEVSGNISYVKTSLFQCERSPCPMDNKPCRHLPKTITFHYLSLPSNLKTPATLFRMATASVPGQTGPNSLRFGIVGGNSRGHFIMQRSDRQTGELILIQKLKGPQTVQVDVDMSEYLDRSYQASHTSKITIFVSPYEF
ncbi:fibulin-7 [Arvicola amphibius]|uniref:fibulin-7 n=1 Tax=Arvicola amphibius TaxID=1047088 RepID=UPI001C093B21|nr:fibulin-7 [Arvicola amphibius]